MLVRYKQSSLLQRFEDCTCKKINNIGPRSMVGTETNLSDFNVAQRNVDQNGLAGKVDAIHNDDKNVIFPAKIFELFGGNNFSFTVCNPPFYEVTEVRGQCYKTFLRP
jgi:23S rRNA A1618 N6-methylase RlmF